MKDIIFDDFQNSVDDSLLRHRSILDIMSKYTESTARVNRAITKAVTNCGCIKINADKQNLLNDNMSMDELNNCLQSHISGKLCDNCREIIEKEMGNNLFYLTSLCNALGVNLYDILLNEYDKINTLGKFTMR
ncbi:DUF1573 domain-containing protein [Inconstantimicrobium porci]|uniref:DUF1573 domain-containing protein n=1 Tax=Inconstantimicrobium porci TaxID=2652291 RepID=A0A7X2T0E4_9CLOT|nr:DUF1573 domain-containing protein [Inconstantimicrobium porci]MDD6769964.1 DUF1573 domain-containing protein [Inconstantimicrobium porci]MSR90482.1 DUF1573 domain-containing protein [Inconstantimicrobium porci]